MDKMTSSSNISEERLNQFCQIFKKYDVNGDGHINLREFKKFSKELGYRFTEQQVEVCNKFDLVVKMTLL